MKIQTSKFSRWANSTLFIPLPGSELVVDPETGNVQPTLSILEATAILKFSNNTSDSRGQRNLGADSAQVFVSGWLVNPMHWPEGVQPPVDLKAIVDGKEGVFAAIPRISSPYDVEAYTGDKISGWFSYKKVLANG